MLSHADSDQLEPRVYTSYRRLINLHAAGLHAAGCRAVESTRPQTGISRSQSLGRGVEFAELKAYQPGDDTRHIDWRATARTGTPWVRVFESDQQKVVTCIVDQTSDLLFGSRVFTKALVAAELAAVCCWDHLALGYNIRLLLQTEQGLELAGIATNTSELRACLRALADHNQALRAFGQGSPRDDEKVVIDQLARQTQRQDIYWFSSSTQWYSSSAKALAMLGRLHDVNLVLVDDPLDIDIGRMRGLDMLGRAGHCLQTSLRTHADLAAAGQRLMSDIQALIREIKSMGVVVYQADNCHDIRLQYHSHRGFGRFEA